MCFHQHASQAAQRTLLTYTALNVTLNGGVSEAVLIRLLVFPAVILMTVPATVANGGSAMLL